MSAAPSVTVRYWASARAAAGVETERLSGTTVGDVLREAATAHTGLEAVLGVSSILLNGRPVSAQEALSEGATLEVLPPFAGG